MENYKEYLEQLHGEYLDTALWMESKMDSNFFDIEDKNNAMNEIIDMLLCAQEAGRSVEATIGKNRIKFFLQYKKAVLPYQNLKRLTTNLMAMFLSILAMSFIYAALDALDDSKNIFLRHINFWPVIIMSIFFATLGDYTSGVVKMKSYNQTKKVRRRRSYIRFVLQTVIAVIIIIPVYAFDLNWSVKLGDITWLCGGLFVIILQFSALQRSVVFSPVLLEAKLISNVQRDYRKKLREKGWDEDRYIKSKKVYFFYVLPVLFTILLIEFVYLLFMLAQIAMLGETGDRIFFFVVLFFAIPIFYFMIGTIIFCRKILRKLMDGRIQLESEL